MSIIRCKECNKEISSMARSCPNCGYIMKNNIIKETISLTIKFIVLTLCFMILFLLYQCVQIPVKIFYNFDKYIIQPMEEELDEELDESDELERSKEEGQRILDKFNR